MSPGTRRHVPFHRQQLPLWIQSSSSPSFQLQGRSPCLELARLGGAVSAILRLRAPLTEVCVLPSAIPPLWTWVMVGKDSPCRATGDNQTHSHSIKCLLDCGKAVFEWDTEEKHGKGLVLRTYST